MTFLMVLSVILVYMLMMLLSTQSAIRHMISDNNLNWLLTWILSTRHCKTGAGSGSLISILEKLNWIYLTGLITLVLLMWKWMGLFLRKNHQLLALTLSSKLDWGSYIISIAKSTSEKIEPWFVLWNFFLLRLLGISINLPYSHVWNTVIMSGLVLLVATWNC